MSLREAGRIPSRHVYGKTIRGRRIIHGPGHKEGVGQIMIPYSLKTLGDLCGFYYGVLPGLNRYPCFSPGRNDSRERIGDGH